MENVLEFWNQPRVNLHWFNTSETTIHFIRKDKNFLTVKKLDWIYWQIDHLKTDQKQWQLKTNSFESKIAAECFLRNFLEEYGRFFKALRSTSIATKRLISRLSWQVLHWIVVIVRIVSNLEPSLKRISFAI